MSARDQSIDRFLAASGWPDGVRSPVSGDASDRRYFRVTRPDGASAVLMDARPEICGSQKAFLTVDSDLRRLGLSAPEVFATDLDAGFILMEDLGPKLFTSEANVSGLHEVTIYTAAVEVLNTLRAPPFNALPEVGPTTLAQMIGPVFDHYANAVRLPVPDDEIQSLIRHFGDALASALGDEKPVTALRDYHAGNLIWLPDRTGAARVGLLDFQDAIATHPAYDLVSLLQDARRDLAPGLERKLVALYVAHNGLDPDRFQAAYCAIGAQRHLRILGVFARLACTARKTEYLRHIPRTWDHLMTDLTHPCLATVADDLRQILPAPTPEVLARLESTR